MPANMTWNEARITSLMGRHVRRASWSAGKWLIIQRGVAWFWSGASWRVVTADDFKKPEFQGSDWTTIPTELETCPIPPDTGDGTGATTDPTTGGGTTAHTNTSDPGNPPAGIILPKPGSAIIIELPGGSSTSVGPSEPSTCTPPTFTFSFTNTYIYAEGYVLEWTVSISEAPTQPWSVSVTAGNGSYPAGIGMIVPPNTSFEWGVGPIAFDPSVIPADGDSMNAFASITGMSGPCAGYRTRLFCEYGSGGSGV